MTSREITKRQVVVVETVSKKVVLSATTPEMRRNLGIANQVEARMAADRRALVWKK